MTISYENASRALVLLILATSFFVTRHVAWVFTYPENYTSVTGAFWIAGTIPYFLVVIGCLLFLLKRRRGLPLILAGGVLSFLGMPWSYVPYLPALASDPLVKVMLLAGGNLAVLALLTWTAWMQRREDRIRSAPPGNP